jgi:hypothetical protein
MHSQNGSRPLFLISLLGFFLLGCQPGTQITEYQAPAHILRVFKSEHPNAQSATYRQMTRDGVKVFLIQYQEGEEDREAWYNAQGKPFISKAEKRSADEQKQKLVDEQAAKAQEEAEEKAAQDAEKPVPAVAPVPTKAKQATPQPSSQGQTPKP